MPFNHALPERAKIRNRVRFREEVTEGIRGLLRTTRHSQAWLARRLGKSPVLICQMLEGSNNFEIDSLADLSLALGRGVHVVFGVNTDEMRLPLRATSLRHYPLPPDEPKLNLPPLQEALALLGANPPSARITDYRIVLARAEMVEPVPTESFGRVQCLQGFERTNSEIVLRTEFRLPVAVRNAESPPDAPPEGIAIFAFAVGITYQFAGTPSVETMTYYSKINGVVHAWPYWRAFVFSMASQMVLNPPPIIPLLPYPEAGKLAGFRAEVAEPTKA